MSVKIPLLDSNFNTTELYVMDSCESCKVALRNLQEAGIEVEIVDLSKIGTKKAFAIWEHRLGRNPNLVPQFWYKGEYIGSSVNIDKFLKEKNVT